MLLNKILELTKEGYSVHMQPAYFEGGLNIVFCGNNLQVYARQNKIIPYYVLEKLDEDDVIHILEEMKNDIERSIKNDRT